jgi:hypothetical protein
MQRSGAKRAQHAARGGACQLQAKRSEKERLLFPRQSKFCAFKTKRTKENNVQQDKEVGQRKKTRAKTHKHSFEGKFQGPKRGGEIKNCEKPDFTHLARVKLTVFS